MALAAGVMRKVDLRGSARPLRERITHETGETVSLHLHNDHRRACVESTPGRHVDPLRHPDRRDAAVVRGPSGKVILAFMEPQEVHAVIAEAAVAGQNPKSIRATLRIIKTIGYAASVDDRSPGVAGLSASCSPPTGSS